MDAHVLIVDDNPDTLNMLAETLEIEGIPVKTANSVLRAIESLHDGSPPPSLIITDLVMPQTTGWDFLKHLRGEGRFRSVPVVVVTGADAGEGEGLADAVLQKPVDLGQLVMTVRSLLASKGTTRDVQT